MVNCHLCERAIEAMPSWMGKRFKESKLMFVLHKPDSRVNSILWQEQKYEMALWTSKSGRQLYLLLRYCGLEEDDIFLTNLFKCTLPGDKKPTKEEYNNCLGNLRLQIETFKPRKIVGFGSAVYRGLFPGRGKISDSIGKQLNYIEVPTLVMNHPSRIWAFLNQKKIEREYERVRRFLKSQ